jgi:hypothetical protein
MGLLSFTDCLPVAVVYASRPSQTGVAFVEGSTVGAARIDMSKVLLLVDPEDRHPYTSLDDVLDKLNYGKKGGISDGEVEKIFNYFANRERGKLSQEMQPLRYKFYLDNEREYERDWIREFGFTRSAWLGMKEEFRDQDWSSSLARDDYFGSEGDEIESEDDDVFTWAHRIVVDSFAFGDAPAVQREAARQGFTAIVYQDAFEAGAYAFKKLMGVRDPDVFDCVEESFGGEEEWEDSMTHLTVRPTSLDHVRWEWQAPAQAVLEEMVMSAIEDGE